jgi:hypothetical protein
MPSYVDLEDKKKRQREYHKLRYERLKNQKLAVGDGGILDKIAIKKEKVIEEELPAEEDKFEEELKKEKSVVEQIRAETIPVASSDQLPPNQGPSEIGEPIYTYRFGKTSKATAVLMCTLISEMFAYPSVNNLKTITLLPDRAFNVLFSRLLEMTLNGSKIFEIEEDTIKSSFTKDEVEKYVLEKVEVVS